MGSHSVQAQGVVLFMIAFLLFAAGLATSARVVFFIAAIVVLALSVWRFRKSKALEEGNGKAPD